MSMRGFTLLEIVLSLALLGLIFGMSNILYLNTIHQEDLELSARSSQELLRRAVLLSGASEGDSTWGVKFDAGTATLFKGASYLARDNSYDEELELQGIEISGVDEYVFEKISGNPTAVGATILSNTATGESREIIVNEKARVSIE